MVSDQFIHDFLATLITFLVVAYLLRLLVRRLARSRDGLRIGTPVAAALGIRILAAAVIGQLSVAATLRGGDEVAFLARAHSVATTSPGSPVWNHELTHELHVVVLGIQKALLDSPDFALRIGQAGLAVAGLVLLATAIYELAGPRAALIGAWLLALEPTNIFFSTIIHKESIMMLATGLVAYGGAIVWKRSELRAFVPIVLGCLIALATRYYAGYFLIAASAAITLHAGIRARRESSTRALVLVALVVMLG